MPKLNFLNPPAFAVKALIIYDDFTMAVKVNNALRCATNRSELSVHWNTKLWRTEILQLRLGAAVAWQDALDAHLIVFALKRAELFPGWLLDWLEQWAYHRQINDVALAVASRENGAMLPPSMSQELSQFAVRHGLSFIFDDRAPRKQSSTALDQSLIEFKSSAPVFLPSFVSEKLHASYRGWGINE